MIRKAIVASFGESWVALQLIDEVESAQSCDSNMGCASSHCGCRVSGRPFKAAIPIDLELTTGDVVEVRTSTGLGAAILIFGIPLIVAAAGWFLTEGLFPDAGEDWPALAAIIGLFAAGGGLFLAGSRKKDKRYPEIVAILCDAGKL